MHCKTCNYVLFDLRKRKCPECGTAFLPSQFDHPPSGVRFCCPHCDQQYYGTDDRGHLVPRTFQCIRCANEVTMDDMIVREPLHRVRQASKPSRIPDTCATVMIVVASIEGIIALRSVLASTSTLSSLAEFGTRGGGLLAISLGVTVLTPIVLFASLLITLRIAAGLEYLVLWVVLRLAALIASVVLAEAFAAPTRAGTIVATVIEIEAMHHAVFPLIVGFALLFRDVRRGIRPQAHPSN